MKTNIDIAKLRHWGWLMLITLCTFLEQKIEIIGQIITKFHLNAGWTDVIHFALMLFAFLRLKNSMPSEKKLEKKGYVRKEDCTETEKK